jgi:hypothetical protein
MRLARAAGKQEPVPLSGNAVSTEVVYADCRVEGSPMGVLKGLIESFTAAADRVLKRGSDKRTLGNLLKDPRWPSGRSIHALAQAIGRDEQTTRNLLNELGARRIILEGDVEGWTLRKIP